MPVFKSTAASSLQCSLRPGYDVFFKHKALATEQYHVVLYK